MEAWSHSQSIFELRKDIALSLGLELENVVVHHTEGAGCYGHNGADDVAFDACLIAYHHPSVPASACSGGARTNWAGRPCSPAMLVEVEAGVDDHGNIVGGARIFTAMDICCGRGILRCRAYWRHGNDGTIRDTSFEKPADCKSGGADRNAVPIYGTGGLDVNVHRMLEMPLRTSSLRGLGAMINVFAIESTINELAAAYNRDPVAYRLNHLDNQRGKDVIEAVVDMRDRVTVRLVKVTAGASVLRNTRA